ncbi:MAG: GNAT family N-acetyltransferase [Bacteroidia bacterium]|jgi:predicted GNAT family N-acyltransferase|nr:GNAT family N-acetyltransferase [Bacteroidia bacterium]
MYQIISPSTPEEFDRYFSLRYDVLRAPWQQPRGSEKDSEEDHSTHAMLTDETGQCIAVGRLQQNSAEEGQIRFMAVHPNWQGKGLGKLVLRHLETEARKLGLQRIVLQARENALNFYLSEGYANTGASFKLWDIIQHYKMEKVL